MNRFKQKCFDFLNLLTSRCVLLAHGSIPYTSNIHSFFVFSTHPVFFASSIPIRHLFEIICDARCAFAAVDNPLTQNICIWTSTMQLYRYSV